MISYSLSQVMNILNQTFSRICVSFEHCKTVIIPNYPYNDWYLATTGTVVPFNWYTKDVINIYVPEKLLPPHFDSPEQSYTNPLPPLPASTLIPTDAIVVDKGAMTALNSAGVVGSPLLHAMGHFFGLPHTFAEINPSSTVTPQQPTNASPTITTQEFADRTNFQNCYDHGDGFCDTEADPYPSSATTNTFAAGTRNCAYSLGLKDGKGNFYTPPCDNFMSLYSQRCRFSQEQYNRMAYIIMTRRLYLH